MEKVIVEVGSTNTKIDLFDGTNVKKLGGITIEFKKHYKQNKEIMENDLKKLTNEINKLKEQYNNIKVCGTSIFRDLSVEEKNKFLQDFKNETGIEFDIISQEEESNLTTAGATRKINEKVCVFIGGGGSTEITIYDKKTLDSQNTNIGVMDITQQFPDLAEDIATTPLEEVMEYIEARLNIPNDTADIMILAGGAHEDFARKSGIHYEENTLKPNT